MTIQVTYHMKIYTIQSTKVENNFFPNTTIKSLVSTCSKETEGIISVVILRDNGNNSTDRTTIHCIQVVDGMDGIDKNLVINSYAFKRSHS